MTGKRYTFVLNFGYAESSRLGYMPWVSNGSYPNARVALEDLAKFLRDEFVLYHDPGEPKKCCVATRTKDAEAKFCNKCGTNLEEHGFDGEEFADWLSGLDTDTDTFNGYIDWDPKKRWQAGRLEGSPNQRFVYQAEWVLAAAVGHAHHNDHTFETVCAERTKNKKESFSYY